MNAKLGTGVGWGWRLVCLLKGNMGSPYTDGTAQYLDGKGYIETSHWKTTLSTTLPQVTVALKLLRKELGASFQLGKPAPLRAVVMVGAPGTRSQRRGPFHWHVGWLVAVGIFFVCSTIPCTDLKECFLHEFFSRKHK